MIKVAALFVETDGAYFGLEGVEPWPIERDARNYTGPWPVVCHSPCGRWGRFATGSTRKPNQYRLGEDFGCFAVALTAVRNYGGVLEHPKDSKAWKWFGLKPPRSEGWTPADDFGGYTCQVEQGHYGHFSRKPTWLYARSAYLPEMIWGRSPQRLPAYAIDRYGYEKARRIGVMAAIGGKRKTQVREATPPPFSRFALVDRARHGR
ncbi:MULTISPECIES: hypothetical protein [unclassified Novosphingobium]|uniref:hypothetical protein n=1 Tax=unclassified Novosphingobium TaxID=2644732 RepID=UPI000D452D6B|nr:MULTISPECIES: hypothetical protein [unclassified Novosphingobium]PTR07905.1 hypothetical protein C8K11_113116 [Novosphingobium sp. GV055]PUB00718.1 hypothetical protein C8K12_113116 [Novosphingobium sp. GV061]PUB16127.1 hypothetical protein C8K14_113116 [Novosphingobium sp. GV079]PUB39592.1 hypothetical protein C8K10_113116 [Novosphingobium sp. GV027]